MRTIELPHALERRKNKLDSFVFTSRVRIARNLEGLKFPLLLESSDKQKIDQAILEWLSSLDEPIEKVNIEGLDQNRIMNLLESRIITPEFIQNGHWVAYNINADWVLQINEEDHLRFFSLVSGYSIKKEYRRLSKLVLLLEEKVDFAFHEKWGYLTSSMLNVGTGLRFSVLVNLFGLMASKQIENLIQSAGNMGYAVKNLAGESGDSGFFIIHNLYSLGSSEEEMLEEFDHFIGLLYDKEMQARSDYFAIDEERELAYEEILELKDKDQVDWENLMYYISLLDALNGKYLKVYDLATLRRLVFQTSDSFLKFKQMVELDEANKVRMGLLKKEISALKYK